MQTSQKIVYVYDSFSSEEPLLLGKLYISVKLKIKNGLTYREL